MTNGGSINGTFYRNCDFGGKAMGDYTIDYTATGCIVHQHQDFEWNTTTFTTTGFSTWNTTTTIIAALCVAVVAAVALAVVKFSKKATEPELPVVVCAPLCQL